MAPPRQSPPRQRHRRTRQPHQQNPPPRRHRPHRTHAQSGGNHPQKLGGQWPGIRNLVPRPLGLGVQPTPLPPLLQPPRPRHNHRPALGRRHPVSPEFHRSRQRRPHLHGHDPLARRPRRQPTHHRLRSRQRPRRRCFPHPPLLGQWRGLPVDPHDRLQPRTVRGRHPRPGRRCRHPVLPQSQRQHGHRCPLADRRTGFPRPLQGQ